MTRDNQENESDIKESVRLYWAISKTVCGKRTFITDINSPLDDLRLEFTHLKTLADVKFEFRIDVVDENQQIENYNQTSLAF